MPAENPEMTKALTRDELEQRNRELTTLIEVMREIPRGLDLTTVLKRVSEFAARVCEAHRCTILLRDEEDGDLWDPVMSMYADGREDAQMWDRFEEKGYPLRLDGASEAARVVREQTPVYVPNAQTSSLPRHLIELFQIESVLLVPLIHRGQVIGLMALDHVDEGRTFTDRQVAMATTFGAQAALAIKNARLFEEAQRRADELAALEVIARELTTTLDSEQIIDRVLERAMGATAAAAGAVGVMSQDEEELMIVSTRGYSPQLVEEYVKNSWSLEKGIIGRVVRTGEPALVHDVTTDPDYVPGTDEPMGSQLTVPVRVEQEVVGYLCLESPESSGFDRRDLRFVEHMAEYAGIAIRNARLYERERRRARQASLLNVVARQVNTILNPEHLLPAVARSIQERFGYDSAIVMLIDADQDALTVAGKSGVAADVIPEDFQQPLSRGIIGWVARHGEPLLANDVSSESRYYAPFPDRFQAGSELAVPLKIEGETVGVLDLQCREKDGFDEVSLSTAETLAEQIAIALQNARLFDEAQHRVGELTALRNIDVALTATLSLDEVLERIHTQISRVIPTTTFYVGIYDDKREKLHIPVIADQGQRLEPVTLDLDDSQGFATWVIRHGSPLWIDDWEEEQNTLPVEGIPRGTPTRSLMVLPLICRGNTVGVISAQSYDAHAFDEHHRRLFSATANQVAIAVQNAKLFEQTTRRLTETRLLQEIMHAAASHLDFDRVLNHTIQALHDTLGLKHLSFAVPDEDDAGLRIHPSQIGYSEAIVSQSVPLDGSVSGRAFKTGEAQMVSDVREVPYYFEGSPDIRSELNVPVQVGGRIVAVLNAESHEEDAFDEDDLRLFQAVAAQLGVMLENTRLYDKLQEQKNELSKAFEKLTEVDRLRAELVQNVSHELRTPFSLVQGYIDLLLEEDLGPIEEDQRYALEIIRSRMGTLKTLFRDLTMLDEVSRNHASSTPTSMIDTVRSAMSDFEPLAKRAGIPLREELPDALSPVKGDKEQLIQVFAHLLDNAIKFSPDGGTITIRGWEETQDGVAYSCVSVSDEGIGIEPEHIDHIFERFYQVDGGANRRFGGMGVGLSLVREIVEAHGGRVTVESVPHEGSTFTVSLPQVTRREHPEEPKTRRRPGWVE